MAVVQNDCKGISYVANDAGVTLFYRKEVSSTETAATGIVNVSGWSKGDDAPTFYVASAVTESNGVTTS